MTAEFYLPTDNGGRRIEIVGGVLPAIVRLDVLEGAVVVDLCDGVSDRPVKEAVCASVSSGGQGVYHFAVCRAAMRSRDTGFGARVKATIR